MQPGQKLTRWWQDYVAGLLTTPRQIYRAARDENLDNAQSPDRFFDLPDDRGFEAPQRLQAPNFILSDKHNKQWGRADWQHADPRLMKWAAIFTELARKRKIPLYVHCAFRGEDEQNEVFAKGNSKARYPSSAHNISEAVDIVHGVFHWDMTPQEWRFLHVLGNHALDRLNATLPKDYRLNLTWGGNFKSLYDPAHWEITDYRTRLRRLPQGEPVRHTPRYILRRL